MSSNTNMTSNTIMNNNTGNRLYFSGPQFAPHPPPPPLARHGSGNLVPSLSSATHQQVLPLAPHPQQQHSVPHHLSKTFPSPSSSSSAQYQHQHQHPPTARGLGFDGATNTSLDMSNAHSKHFTTGQHSQQLHSTSSVPYGGSVSAGGGGGGGAMPAPRRSKEDPTKTSRQEQVESPNSKASYKSFAKQFALKEAISVDDALRFAQEEAVKVPPKIKWRVYIDAADLLKRNYRFDEAKYMFALVTEEYPLVQQGWMEWSKMEEERGRFRQSLKHLRDGAEACVSYNEVLLMKAIRQHEKLSHLTGARELLGKLTNEPIEKIWRTVLEGALLEERAGNVVVARKLLSVLVHRVAWYGPIYYEAFRLEEKAELFHGAYLIIRKGLAELPRYGPLWFGLLRIMERADIEAELQTWQRGDGAVPLLTCVRRECQSAICSISRELVWKVHFEQAQIEERAASVVAQSQALATNTPVEVCLDALLHTSRQCFILSMLACPSNLRWKIFLAGARMELSAGKIETVKSLLRQAHIEVPEKSRFHVFLECARLEEYVGSVTAARQILSIARSSIKNEWKIYLESVLVEARAGNVTTAIFIADQALTMDSGSGRLWAILLQLVHRCPKHMFVVC
jgi:hypothetical protein